MAPFQGNPVPHGLKRAKKRQASPQSPWGLPWWGRQLQTVRPHAPEYQLVVAGARKEKTHAYRRTHTLELSPAKPSRLRVSPPKSKDLHMCVCHTDIAERLTHTHMHTHHSGTVKTGGIIIHSTFGEHQRVFIAPSQKSPPSPGAHQSSWNS